MHSRDEIQLMVQVARLYHENQLNQEEIARRLGITRQKVSRLLIAAKAQGIVRTVVYDPMPGDPDLGSKLKQRFNLKRVVLAKSDMLEPNQLRSAIGMAAVELLTEKLQDDQIVGIGCGRTLYETINLTRPGVQKRIHVVPLIGGIGDISPFFQVNELARSLAHAFGGTYRHLYVPAFIEDQTVWENLQKTQEVVQASEYWKRLDIAIVGVGHVEFQHISSMFFASHISARTLDQLKKSGTVGDICARFFDIQGNQVFPEIGVTGIDLDRLKTVPEVIGVAGGLEKVRALTGALRGGFLHTLVTDTATARAILAETNGRR
ncbi:MAG: sugar-binding transcriptional regulator [Anaerolineae bacterium]|nr:sugar-binding transcriptional regulator [Anaerolineae bacterium]